MNIVHVGDFTVSHSSVEADYRVVSSRRTFDPFLPSFENHERMTSRRQETRARRSYFFTYNVCACVCVCLIGFFLIISLCDSWRRSNDRSSSVGLRRKKYCRPTFLWRDEFAAQHPGPDFRGACSLVVCAIDPFSLHTGELGGASDR